MGGGMAIHEKLIYRGDCLKRGGLGQHQVLRGDWQKKRGVVFLRGVDTPMHTMIGSFEKRNFQNSPPFKRLVYFYIIITVEFERFRYVKSEISFPKN